MRPRASLRARVELTVRRIHSEVPRQARNPPHAKPLPPPQPKSRVAKCVSRTVVLGVIGTGAYLVDREYNASAITRSLRTAYIGVAPLTPDKINFKPEKSDEIEALHTRVAQRLRWVVDTNQGMYLKLGQAIGLQASMLPKPYREAFAHVFDQAPSVPYEEVVGVFKRDLGIDPTDIFETFSTEAVASASVAQVHKATLKAVVGNPDRVVAVKVQKPAIAKQMDLDLFSYRTLMYLAQKAFDLPLYFVAKYVSEQMRHETSFNREARNARKCAAYLAQTPELADDIMVPKVYGKEEGYPESDRILVMEWVDGCRLTDKKQIEAWGLKPRDVMDLAIALNAAMTFSWGFVHCDPHPGNILVRPHPTKRGKPQLIVLDHGLYITLREQFREEYATLWRSLFVLDVPKVEEIGKRWGFGLDPNMFASAILLRPAEIKKAEKKERKTMDKYHQQLEVKKQLKVILENEKFIPRELILLGRCQRMMQANNQTLGSPSSRVNITAEVGFVVMCHLSPANALQWAARGWSNSLTGSRTLHAVGLKTWLHDRWEMVLFRITVWAIDALFRWTNFRNSECRWEDVLTPRIPAVRQQPRVGGGAAEADGDDGARGARHRD
ncbi:hypothetical protein VHUM_00953 [Vanrija humicola]|uniref:ABC1 atypical kinase-like domain-containing protein n=1 Tax=Vanrija humicola TaxID=5417 RepID=A0A7D8V4E0_VANHU|nr:hypothetical protein VHUM_00953 [Vanrija humicola]